MRWLTDPFTFGFMQKALAAGLGAVVASSLVGTWVVLRGLTFVGDALAHGVLPGVAIAFLLGVSLPLGAGVAAVVMLGLVALVNRRTHLPEDVGIGLLFVGMLSLGIVIISKRASYSGDLTAILFGDPIGATSGDVAMTAIAAVVAIVTTVVFYRPFLVLTFSPRKAEVLGLRPGRAQVVMLGLVALVVTTAFRTVGTLLVFALLVAPPATASLVVRRVPAMMAAGVGFGSAAVVFGLLISFHAGTAAAATVAGVAVLQFFVMLAARELVLATRRREVARA